MVSAPATCPPLLHERGGARLCHCLPHCPLPLSASSQPVLRRVRAALAAAAAVPAPAAALCIHLQRTLVSGARMSFPRRPSTSSAFRCRMCSARGAGGAGAGAAAASPATAAAPTLLSAAPPLAAAVATPRVLGRVESRKGAATAGRGPRAATAQAGGGVGVSSWCCFAGLAL